MHKRYPLAAALLGGNYHLFAELPYNLNWMIRLRADEEAFLKAHPLVVTDVGCRGEAPKELLTLFPYMDYHAFDADAEECARMEKTAHPYASRRLFPRFIGEKPGPVTFNLFHKPGESSSLEPGPRFKALYRRGGLRRREAVPPRGDHPGRPLPGRSARCSGPGQAGHPGHRTGHPPGRRLGAALGEHGGGGGGVRRDVPGAGPVRPDLRPHGGAGFRARSTSTACSARRNRSIGARPGASCCLATPSSGAGKTGWKAFRRIRCASTSCSSSTTVTWIWPSTSSSATPSSRRRSRHRRPLQGRPAAQAAAPAAQPHGSAAGVPASPENLQPPDLGLRPLLAGKVIVPIPRLRPQETS